MPLIFDLATPLPHVLEEIRYFLKFIKTKYYFIGKCSAASLDCFSHCFADTMLPALLPLIKVMLESLEWQVGFYLLYLTLLIIQITKV